MESRFRLDASSIDKLSKAMEEYQGNTEEVINRVLHTEAGAMIEESILQLMPVSGRTWKGKPGAAKTSKSLMSENGNLSVTVKTTKKYQYLYFPDDGTNTRRHVGNQQFFRRGGESRKDEIIEMCINELTKVF